MPHGHVLHGPTLASSLASSPTTLPLFNSPTHHIGTLHMFTNVLSVSWIQSYTSISVALTKDVC